MATENPTPRRKRTVARDARWLYAEAQRGTQTNQEALETERKLAEVAHWARAIEAGALKKPGGAP